MPAYCTESFVKLAIDSVMTQTYPNIELIVIEDCSPDGTRAKIEESLEQHGGRFTLVRREKNSGLAAAYGDGAMMAKGEFITQMDSDDLMPPASVADRVAYMQSRPDLQFIHTDFLMIDGAGKVLPDDGTFYPSPNNEANWCYQVQRDYRTLKPKDLFDFVLIHKHFIHLNTVMYRREVQAFWQTYDDKEVYYLDDYDFCLRSLLRHKWGHIGTISQHYRSHATNTNKRESFDDFFRRQTAQWIRVYEKLYDDILSLKDNPYAVQKKEVLLEHAYYFWLESGSMYEPLGRNAAMFGKRYGWQVRVRAFFKKILGIDVKYILRKKPEQLMQLFAWIACLPNEISL
ncbi:MAG: glycosyltransferase [Rhizobacter sp.]|nr:glycosyltransferase [Chlorobiales bacterium]